MSWARDNLRAASFRGIGFSVVAAETAEAKAIVVHEFPGRDDPYIEELGRLARRFDIEAYISGDDCLEKRDRLIAALYEPGPGELVHPYYGSLQVHAVITRVRHEAGEGRVVRLGLSFVRAGVQVTPQGVTSPAAAVDRAGRVMLDVAQDTFAEGLVMADRPGVAAEGAAAGWERVAETLSTFDLKGPADKAAAWKAALEDLTDNALERLGQPHAFAESVRKTLRDLDGAYGSRRELLRLLMDLSRGEGTRTQPLLYGGADADGGDSAMATFVARDAAAEAARLSVLFDWETYDEAHGTRQDIAQLLFDLADAADDATYNVLQDLVAELVANLPRPGLALPRLGSLTLTRTVPAMLLAYQLYDGLEREGDIVARNRVANPAFLPTLRELQVLVDVDG